MKVRIALCIVVSVLFIAALPSIVQKRAAFSTVAIAGHTQSGLWCDCGTPGCFCDPGEHPGGNGLRVQHDNPPQQQEASDPQQSFDPGTFAGLLILFGFFVSRMIAK